MILYQPHGQASTATVPGGLQAVRTAQPTPDLHGDLNDVVEPVPIALLRGEPLGVVALPDAQGYRFLEPDGSVTRSASSTSENTCEGCLRLG